MAENSDTSSLLFEWVRRETFYTKRDLEDLDRQSLPHPQGSVELDDLFKEFCVHIECEDVNMLMDLARSSVNPFFPTPFRLTNASFENPRYFIPEIYHQKLFGVWVSQLTSFILKLCAKNK